MHPLRRPSNIIFFPVVVIVAIVLAVVFRFKHHPEKEMPPSAIPPATIPLHTPHRNISSTYLLARNRAAFRAELAKPMTRAELVEAGFLSVEDDDS
ncbi:hypothetical protein K402DRAFT_459550 [Aulographum hederae CBS 113979]|uniref:Uncharacterized protein n=1 Tax=Aulographum hederae CBS 113979 TaxID=1176131 RepID=A0A6G1HEA0_9PEZI|nr:hypothetical protein K402DRAFT_459550 [Aulographum hederae CBS 113979]